MVLKAIAASGTLPEPAVQMHLSTLELEAKVHQQLEPQTHHAAEHSQQQIQISPQIIPGAPYRLYVYRDWITSQATLQTLKNLSHTADVQPRARNHPDLHEVDKEMMYVS